jgi:hypothetical protein
MGQNEALRLETAPDRRLGAAGNHVGLLGGLALIA